MAIFELRKVCNELLAELEATTRYRHLITLSVDVTLNDTFKGSPQTFTESIRASVLQLSQNLLKGSIHIEIALHDKQGTTLTTISKVKVLSTDTDNSKTNRRISVKLKHVLDIHEENNSVNPFPLSGKKVLVAEDNEINAMVFVEFLEEWGAEIYTAVNGIEAVAQSLENDFDIILMDTQMPVLDGKKATMKIREFNIGVPIIALVTSSSDDAIKEVLSCGATDFLLKPVNNTELLQVLSRYK